MLTSTTRQKCLIQRMKFPRFPLMPLQKCISRGGDAFKDSLKMQKSSIIYTHKVAEKRIKIIKRVIGLEGDFIRTMGYKNRYVKVPDGHFWIEGDHHGHSLDSNSFGPVSVGLLHGRASHIIWPPHRWQRISPALPPNRGPLEINEDQE
uniref:Mitochondrial inner membrane protease subunit 2 n=1 Tax=Periophthalmus magnuspinnatus TaxID=409849 RepID=A0A3B3ZBI0_9GOBI